MYFSRIKKVGPMGNADHPDSIHKCIWKFFPGVPSGQRPFIYRFDLERGTPTFYVVSEQQACSPDATWRVESKAYDPQLETGDRLMFTLRINPTIVVNHKRHEPVMHYKQTHPQWFQETTLPGLEHQVLGSWLERQAASWGFETEPSQFLLDHYEMKRFAKKRTGNKQQIQIAVAELNGHLRVTDVAHFRKHLFQGMGRAKGFGCGLMMVRRPL